MRGSQGDSSFSNTLVAPSLGYSSGSSGRIQSTTHSIPSPGSDKPAPKPYEPILLNLIVAVGSPIVLMALGIALETATNISTKQNGFKVPTVNVFGTVSGQFLASVIPTLVIIPNAILYRLIEWDMWRFQPYLVLQKGHARAEESVLLDYVELGPILGLFRALAYKHRIILLSCFTVVVTYGFQPLSSSIFQIRQINYTESLVPVNNIESLALAPSLEIEQLNGFLAAAGYVEAAALHGLGDPPFVFQNWATAEFQFPQGRGLNGTLSINTTAIRTNINCDNPPADVSLSGPPDAFILTAESIGGCRPVSPVTFNSTAATQQYGVASVNCADTPESDPNFQQVMFWFFHSDGNTQQARAVFCAPTIEPFSAMATAHFEDGRLDSCERSADLDNKNNNVTGSSAVFGGKAFNSLFFNESADPFVQARSTAIRSGVSGAIFRQALLRPEGIQAVFDRPNGMLELTQPIYTQHLAVSARSLYFQRNSSMISGERTSFIPRLVIDPLPAHLLSFGLFLVGIVGLLVNILHRRQRRKLILAAPPGTIAAAVALTAHSGFGQLLLPYDDEAAIEKKLHGIKFRLDKRTGAIVADETLSDEFPGTGRDEALLSLLGQQQDRLSQHSSSETALQAAVGYPPWVHTRSYEYKPIP